MRTDIEPDDTLIEEAFRLTGIQTERAVVQPALEELVRINRKMNSAEPAGRITFSDDFDYKAMRAVRTDDL